MLRADADYEAHVDRLHEEVRFLPCSPGCAHWLPYGIQPDSSRSRAAARLVRLESA
ncbi:MAG: hypothetical protein QOF52_1063 [Propionibacteriaceae bacterium]|jgi:hypothetical protein|nr:replication initiator protein [Propionibacteriaceae bacterium]MDX6321205.1 hypothetical protein [Propionibacteriaceae bacterium]